jgi:nicotinate-nucleotide pyrophosphorylase (carboxylating)
VTDGLRAAADDADRLARIALEEDGSRDITSAVTVSSGAKGLGRFEFRTGGVVAGLAYADAVARAAGLGAPAWQGADGDLLAPHSILGSIEGQLSALLRAERPMLNLLQRATGIATATRAYVDAVAGTACRVLHTRKTAPGLRALDVRAALAGGGALHRTDLARTVMVKDNHWRALEGAKRTLESALAAANAAGAIGLQVEVESLKQLETACKAGAGRLLVDNQRPETLRAWAERARALAPGIEIEATGGITLDNVRAYAEAGADFVSVGALTHSVCAADIALEIEVG